MFKTPESVFAISPAGEEQIAESFSKTLFAQVIRAAGIDESKITAHGELLAPIYFSLEKAGGFLKITQIDLLKGVKLESSHGFDSMFHEDWSTLNGITWDMFGAFKEITEEEFLQDRAQYEATHPQAF